MRADHGEGAYHRLASVDVTGPGDLDVGGGPDPSGQEVVPELLGRPECPALGVIGPGDAIGVLPGHGHEVPLVEGLVTSAVGLDVRRFHDSSFAALPPMTRSSSRPPLARTVPSPFPVLSVSLLSRQRQRAWTEVASWASGRKPESSCAAASSPTSTAPASKTRCPAGSGESCSPTSS